MKNTLIILSLLAAYSGWGQQAKPTGGCGQIIFIDSIGPVDTTARCIFSDEPVNVMVSINPYSPCIWGKNGYIVLEAATVTVAKMDAPDVYAQQRYTIPVSPHSFPAGRLQLAAIYYEGSSYSTVKYFTVCDRPENEVTKIRAAAPDTAAEHAPDITALKDLTIYPTPARSELHISGISHQEHYQLQLTDMQGRQVLPAGVAMCHGTITIPVAALPAGLYILHLQTETRTLTRKISILH